MTATLLIEEPGLLTTVQDAGRFGWQQFGMPVSGALDGLALRLANRLVGNPPGAACLEITLTGPTLTVSADTWLAVCGAEAGALLNGRPLPGNRAWPVAAGERLTFRGMATGCRACLAFAGGIAVPALLGSRATCLRTGLGGHEGRPLRAGDRLMLGPPQGVPWREPLPEALTALWSSQEPIRILPGPEIGRFGLAALEHLLTTPWRVGPQSNRMGCRLEGAGLPLIAGKSADLLSSATPPGTLQVPADGWPILLLADRQTTGGYPRIACVASVDLPRVAQLRPGAGLRFREISLAAAQALAREREMFLRQTFGDC